MWNSLGKNSRATLNPASTPRETPKALTAFSGPLVLGGCQMREMAAVAVTLPAREKEKHRLPSSRRARTVPTRAHLRRGRKPDSPEIPVVLMQQAGSAVVQAGANDVLRELARRRA